MSRVIAIRQGQPRAVVMAGLRGKAGEQGEQGAPFQVGASGLLANRGAFDAELEGFSYLATDTGDLYYRQGAAGNWSDPVPFQGPAGDSAYQVAVANGFVGTEADWLASLAGADGVDGADGLSITGAAIDGNGHLLLTLSNSTVLDAGYVVGQAGANGADGADGRGIASMAIDGSNHLIITYTDSTTQDVGLIPGAGGSASWGSIGGTLADQTDLVAALAEKVDTEAGKGLSSNDFTTAEQTKLAGIEDGAQANAAAVSQAEAEDGTGTSLRSWTVQRVWQAIAAWWAASSMKTKLDGIATGATANSPDATLLARSNHTGTQAASTISDLAEVTQDMVGAMIVAGTNVTVSYNDVAGTLTISATGGGGGMTNPMTTAGDIITGGTSGAAQRLAGGVNGQRLTMVSGAPAWAYDLGVTITESTTARNATLTDVGNYLRHVNASASTLTIPPQSSVAWPDDAEIHVRRAAAGNLTLTPGSGVTLNAPSGGTLVMTNAMTVTLKRVAADVWDVIGQTVPA